MLKQARASGATELSAPGDVLVVEKLPLLGTGKTDYVSAGALAKERFGKAEVAA
jgi:acyl-[acyl-carrier-protein]-phospholipid O-acyltransferase/long-chain-fatty-acid--[acyl-carrier-protein] ligase